MSTAGPVDLGGTIGVGPRVFVKRHDWAVRAPDDLVVEHRLAAHLRAAGVAAPEVMAAGGRHLGLSLGRNSARRTRRCSHPRQCHPYQLNVPAE